MPSATAPAIMKIEHPANGENFPVSSGLPEVLAVAGALGFELVVSDEDMQGSYADFEKNHRIFTDLLHILDDVIVAG